MLEFLKEYIKHPRSVGAIAPSGQFLAQKMMEPIDFDKAKLIVEYGPGTGSFTRELVERKKPETRLVLIEHNKSFCRTLSKWLEKRGVENVRLVRASAAQAVEILASEQEAAGRVTADYVVSGLPFTSLPKKHSEEIFEATKEILGENGEFITFQYSMVKLRFFLDYFDLSGILRELRNVPPAYVFVLRNKAAARAAANAADKAATAVAEAAAGIEYTGD